MEDRILGAPPGGAARALNVYVDSSVLLRGVLAERGRLRSGKRISHPVASELIRLECLRTIDRARIQLILEDRAIARHRADVLEALAAIHLS